MPATTPQSQRLLGGLLVRRERWSLSGAGWLLAAAVAAATCVGFVRGVHHFLAVSDGGDGDVMVVEGWIGGRRLAQAADIFLRGHYRCVVVVRDVYSNGDKWSSGGYSADYIATDLSNLGVPKDRIHTVFCPLFQQDRTYHCALAARTWLANNSVSAKQLDVVTIGCHSRRSRLLYEKAFGGGVKVGAISLEDPTFDAAHWWRTSEGVRDVPFEFVAYLYARFLFTDHSAARGAKPDQADADF